MRKHQTNGNGGIVYNVHDHYSWNMPRPPKQGKSETVRDREEEAQDDSGQCAIMDGILEQKKTWGKTSED